MGFKLTVLLCALSAVLAYPHDQAATLYDDSQEFYDEGNNAMYIAEPEELYRVRRQVVGGAGDLSTDKRVPVWKSDDGRHQFDVTGGYTPNFGVPEGISRPDYRVGAIYTLHF